MLFQCGEGSCLLKLVKLILSSNVLNVLLQCHIDVSDLLYNFDHDLFYKVCTTGHCLHHCLPLLVPLVTYVVVDTIFNCQNTTMN